MSDWLFYFQLVTANERLEKQTAAASSEEKKDHDSGLEDVKYYKDELEREVEKNSNLQDEISALRQKELERITDEFSLEWVQFKENYCSLNVLLQWWGDHIQESEG